MPKPRKRKACRECAKMESRLKSISAELGDVRAVKNGLRDEIERLRAEIARLQERANRWIHNFELLNKEFCDMELRCEALIRERDEALDVNERQARLIVQHALERQRKPWWKRLGEIVREWRGKE